MNEYGVRISTAQEVMRAGGIDALCLSVGSDLPYLTGYKAMPTERLTMFVLPAEGEGTIVVPRLEAPRVEADAMPFSVQSWRETEDPIAITDRLLPDAGSIMVGDETWSRFLIDLQDINPGRLFTKASELMTGLRITKSPSEIARLRAAAATVDGVVDQLESIQFSGRTERDVAREVTERTNADGHETMEFWIVASGPNGASPHHESGDRVIGQGDAVVVDFGGHQNGYASDTTRMFVVGEAPYGFDDAYEVLHAAQVAAVDFVRPGVTAESVDAVARDIITEAGYGDLFIHRTGHGIGMDTHEHPFLVEGNDQIIEEGMTFSIEPGIYAPGEWGMRIEDIVAVTADGVERLNRSNRAYRVVP
ncbi:MAG: Xaa-Pro peptidase family protein [Acidimicrobiia bacterium]|nr:MAG: Xaa-Pro peptidase family protein [Acidimicrobiia bacterium]